MYSDLNYTPRFTTLSEISFTIYKKTGPYVIDWYDKFSKNMLINMNGYGWFVITQTSETTTGNIPYKSIQCKSHEYTLISKGILSLGGTMKFYDPTHITENWIDEFTKNLVDWKVGHIDSELWNTFRTFDIPSDANVYGYLNGEMSKTYECLFVFDYQNLTINAYKAANIVHNTNIILTFDNVLQNVQIQELEKDVITVLSVNGAENVSISRINPIGSNKIYNFDYYIESGMIRDSDLIFRIRTWEQLIETMTPQYTTLLTNYNEKQKEYIINFARLNDLENEISALNLARKPFTELQAIANRNGTDDPDWKRLTNEIHSAESARDTQKILVETNKSELDAINVSLDDIVDQIAFEKYFSNSELRELDRYVVEGTYQDDNFIVTDEMRISSDTNGETIVLTANGGAKKIKDLTPQDIILDEMFITQQLLEAGKEVLSKESQPALSFSASSMNFLFNKEFQPFINEIGLGYIINIELEPGVWVYPALLEMSFNFDDPNSFNMTFSNRFKLGTNEWTWADLYQESQRAVSKVGSTLSIASEPFLNGEMNRVREFINSNLEAAKNMIVDSEANRSFTVGSYGARCVKTDPVTGEVDPHQLGITEQLIAMTDDNWEHVKLAIGKMNGIYSINAEVIAGNLLIGEGLIIENDSGTFIVDGDGATMVNANITVRDGDTDASSKRKVIISQNDGFVIQTRPSIAPTSWDTKFQVRTDGSLLANTLEAQQLTIRNTSSGNRTATLTPDDGLIITNNSLRTTLSADGGLKLENNLGGGWAERFSFSSTGSITASNLELYGGQSPAISLDRIQLNINAGMRFQHRNSINNPWIDVLNINSSGNITIQDYNQRQRIQIASSGLDLQTSSDGVSWVSNISMNSSGLTLNNINAQTGKIGGFNISSTSIYSTNNELVLNADGSIHIQSGTLAGLPIMANAYGASSDTFWFDNLNGSGRCGPMSWYTLISPSANEPSIIMSGVLNIVSDSRNPYLWFSNNSGSSTGTFGYIGGDSNRTGGRTRLNMGGASQIVMDASSTDGQILINSPMLMMSYGNNEIQLDCENYEIYFDGEFFKKQEIQDYHGDRWYVLAVRS